MTSAALATIFPSIYVDVQVVLASPMARQAAPVVDRRKGLPWLAGAIGIGIFAGYVFVVPGLAAVAVAGQLKLPLGEYLIFGAPIGIATALLTTFLFRMLLQTSFWDERTDIDPDEEEHPDNPGHAAYLARGEIGHESTGSSADADLDDPDAVPERALRLPLLLPSIAAAAGLSEIRKSGGTN